jgi:hypothetical protein
MRTVLFPINADAYTLGQSSFCRKNEDWDMGHRVVWYVGINVSVECAFIFCFANGGSKALRNVGTAVHSDIQQDCNLNTFVVVVVSTEYHVYKLMYRRNFDLKCISILFSNSFIFNLYVF